MTATTAPVTLPHDPGSPLQRLRWGVNDSLAVTGRNLRHWLRQPPLLVFSTIQPIMFVLLFNYVFGGAIPTPGEYIQFLLPGIFCQVVIFGTTQTAVGLAEDLAGGMIDRFRSLPMARWAVLSGRTTADAGRGLFVVLLITVVGSILGFRFEGGALRGVAAIALVVAFGFAMSWVFALVGLSVKGAEAAQAVSFVTVFPLVFASSAFVPTATMPGWLAAFANNQPITRIVDAVRALTTGAPAAEAVLIALAWITGILVVFSVLATRRYRRAE